MMRSVCCVQQGSLRTVELKQSHISPFTVFHWLCCSEVRAVLQTAAGHTWGSFMKGCWDPLLPLRVAMTRMIIVHNNMRHTVTGVTNTTTTGLRRNRGFEYGFHNWLFL